MQIYFIIKYLLWPFTCDSPPTLTPSLSIVWALKFGHCQPNPILILPWNHAFTIKTSASYLEKSLSTSKLLISALEIHRHFVTFSCPSFCLLFSKPTLTVSFGKYRLSIIFSLNYIIKIIFRSGNYPHNQWNCRSRVRHCLRVFCVLYLGYPTESTKAVNSSSHGGDRLTRLKSRTAREGLKCNHHSKRAQSLCNTECTLLLCSFSYSECIYFLCFELFLKCDHCKF